MVRLAKLMIDAASLEAYKSLLKEEIEASLRLEPGVLTLYPMAAQAEPAQISILEVYADEAAYQAHLKTPHFLRYKEGTQAMVLSLELVEVQPLFEGMRLG